MAKKTVQDPGSAVKQFMGEYGISSSRLALMVGISSSAVRQIVLNKMKISIPVALRFAKYFGNDAEYWIGLQVVYDLGEARRDTRLAAALKKIPKGKRSTARKTLTVTGRGKSPARPGVKKGPAARTAKKAAKTPRASRGQRRARPKTRA